MNYKDIDNSDTKYFISMGEEDKKRLSIVNEAANPYSQQMLMQCGLKKGMTVLDVGCGMGHMSCWLAKKVGRNGRVIAIDNSSKQLEIAKEMADSNKINNIKFYECDILDIEKINIKYNFTYGRWVLIFTADPRRSLISMYENMENGGILTYEDALVSVRDNFILSELSAISRWYEISEMNMNSLNLDPHFAIKMHPVLREIGARKISLHSHQTILTSEKEKSIFRLGLKNMEKSILKNLPVISEDELSSLSKELYALETNNNIILPYFKNIFISCYKS